jgi:hypothetical protein
MKEISYRLRESIIDEISPLEYEGKLIPVFDQKVTDPKLIPTLNFAQVYVLLNSQTVAETTNDKCKIRLDANVSFDVVTKYPSGRGGSLLSEKIGELILEQINRALEIDSFSVLNVTMNFNQNLSEESNSQSVFRKIISYRFDVFQD